MCVCVCVWRDAEEQAGVRGSVFWRGQELVSQLNYAHCAEPSYFRGERENEGGRERGRGREGVQRKGWGRQGWRLGMRYVHLSIQYYYYLETFHSVHGRGIEREIERERVRKERMKEGERERQRDREE